MLFIYMSKYPGVILFRHNNYSEVDSHIEENKENLMCTIHITNNIEDLNKLFNPNYHILVTYGSSYDEYHNCIASKLPERFSGRWFHKTDISNIDEFNHNVNYCYISNVINTREKTRPIFSIFTTCFKSYDYIDTAYESIKKQSLIDWEWVIMDDTPEDEHFTFLKNKLSSDNRVRLYKRDENSGNIGNVKNEVISLCRGKYILEMDHDDEILIDCLRDAYNIFKTDENIGFVYGDTIHLYRNGTNFKYGDFICKGYGGYYMEKIKGEWVYVYNTPNINNITLSHLVCLPNHPRIWNRSVLMELESYSEFLPICDDYEILLRTCCSKYKVAKNNKAQYIQYMNDGGNNFSNIRNSEINRLGPKYISPMFYKKYGVHDKMKELDAYENENYTINHSPIWKRGEKYQHKKMNQRINLNYDKQYCIINDAINDMNIVERLKELYKNGRNDFLFLSNCMTHEEMYHKLESLGFDRMKCYSFTDCSEDELTNYFKMVYANDNCEHEIIDNNNTVIDSMDSMKTLKLNYNKNTSELCEIGKKYDTDKSSQRNNVTTVRHCHPYTLFYDGLFKNKKHANLKIAELGILDGSSLLMWKEYFTNAEIYGFEYNNDLITKFKNNFNNDRIVLANIDVTNKNSIVTKFNELNTFYDVIIDDTTHQFEDQIRVIENTYQYLKPGGIFIIEDIFKAYNEMDYINRLKPILHHFQDFYFIELDHNNKNSTGWNNDKLFILIKGDDEPIFKNTNKITIITPSYRTDNLLSVKNSIDFDYVHEWIIVYDGSKITENPNMFKHENNDKIKEYVYKGDGISGNPQRNYALTKITNKDTFLYYLDDDNIIHPTFYKLLNLLDTNKIYTFNQENSLKGNNINVRHIDTAMCVVHYNLCQNIEWINDKYDADGYYIKSCYDKNKDKHIYIDNDMCYYNKLGIGDNP